MFDLDLPAPVESPIPSVQTTVFTDIVGQLESMAPAYKTLPMPNLDPTALVFPTVIYGHTQVSPPRGDATPPNLSPPIELPLFNGTTMAASFTWLARAGCYSLHQTLATLKVRLALNGLVMARSSFSIDVFVLVLNLARLAMAMQHFIYLKIKFGMYFEVKIRKFGTPFEIIS